ncbi:aryl-sulfate sulfotransferase [Halorubellus sp. PRR65]|uniref:aryl-sulfate sulfotransferase n=1 Tax=Halorubellus sp. PRR65 TaxID=3098148 RepID=UPI002B25A948|nr:aryl-sulfate sulfotransferase [Halorubellus sp. PRR65]
MNVGSTVAALRQRRTRVAAYVAIVLVLALALGFQAVTADGVATSTTEDGRWTATPPETGAAGTTNGSSGTASTPNRTGVLVTVQSYGGFGENNGRAVVVEDGDVVWSFAPEDSRVFDAEMLDDGNVLVSYATQLPASECPERTLEHESEQCVRNNVVEVDYETNEETWAYRWYDAFITHHEVHDADRLPNGETAIVDMGNDRAFVVNESKSVVWEWRAREHIGPGTDFWETFGGPDRPRPESDWTHMNDIDRLADGDFSLSIRNFDVVLEVNRSTKAIERVVGEVRESGEDVEGREPILDDQHNPMWVSSEHVLVADSEADRIVEVNASTQSVVWSYDDGLLWPRDADRLPNGNTLVTNSLRYEVEEVTPDGEVVWRYQVAWNGKRGIPYEADRVQLPEEPEGTPTLGGGEPAAGPATAGTAAPSATGTATPEATGTAQPVASEPAGADGDGARGGLVERLAGYAFLYLPFWVGSLELVLLGGVVAVGVVAAVDGVAFALGRLRDALA